MGMGVDDNSEEESSESKEHKKQLHHQQRQQEKQEQLQVNVFPNQPPLLIDRAVTRAELTVGEFITKDDLISNNRGSNKGTQNASGNDKFLVDKEKEKDERLIPDDEDVEGDDHIVSLDKEALFAQLMRASFEETLNSTQGEQVITLTNVERKCFFFAE